MALEVHEATGIGNGRGTAAGLARGKVSVNVGGEGGGDFPARGPMVVWFLSQSTLASTESCPLYDAFDACPITVRH